MACVSQHSDRWKQWQHDYQISIGFSVAVIMKCIYTFSLLNVTITTNSKFMGKKFDLCFGLCQEMQFYYEMSLWKISEIKSSIKVKRNQQTWKHKYCVQLLNNVFFNSYNSWIHKFIKAKFSILKTQNCLHNVSQLVYYLQKDGLWAIKIHDLRKLSYPPYLWFIQPIVNS